MCLRLTTKYSNNHLSKIESRSPPAAKYNSKTKTNTARNELPKWGNYTDLKKTLNDDIGSVRLGRGQDGTFDKTVVGVYTQPRFPKFIIATLERILAARENPSPHLEAMFCVSCFHRTDVSLRTLMCALNSVVDPFTDERVFNCQMFTVVHCTGKRDAQQVLEQAIAFAKEPWVLIPATVYGEVYGASAVLTNKDATTAHDAIWSKYPWDIDLGEPVEVKEEDDDDDGDAMPPRKKQMFRKEPLKICVWVVLNKNLCNMF